MWERKHCRRGAGMTCTEIHVDDKVWKLWWSRVLSPKDPSTFCGIFPHLNHVFRIPHSSQILWNHKYYRISLDSHQMDVKSLIQGTLSPSKDDLWALFYTITNDACPLGTEIKRLRQETDRWIERGRCGGGGGSYLERIPKHSWMSCLGSWFRIQSTKCWQVC